MHPVTLLVHESVFLAVILTGESLDGVSECLYLHCLLRYLVLVLLHSLLHYPLTLHPSLQGLFEKLGPLL